MSMNSKPGCASQVACDGMGTMRRARTICTRCEETLARRERLAKKKDVLKGEYYCARGQRRGAGTITGL